MDAVRIVAAPRKVLSWISERAHCALTADARGIAAVDARGNIRGMVAYDGWTENACQAHMAVDSPIVWRHLVRPAFQYPFLQAGKNVLVGVIPSHNERSVEMTRALGFIEKHRIADGWAPGDDMIVFEMRRSECRWLEV